MKALEAIRLQFISIYDHNSQSKTKKKLLLRWLPHKKNHSLTPIKGLYIWGSVGRGKTFLMDLFFNQITIKEKKRIHFNHFMKMAHQMLQSYKGIKSPLDKVADEIAASMYLICFDEFFVEDIADAMILGGLFKKLFDRGVCLIATSNVEPKKLYLGGLQRESFLPAIDALMDNVEVFNLDSGIDYRWRAQAEIKRYFYNESDLFETMESIFRQFCENDDYIKNQTLLMEGREVEAVALSEKVAWFLFDKICGYGRGTYDYIEMAAKYDAVLISQVPILDESQEDEARRFISLVDEFYDSRLILVLEAKVPLKDLYQGEKLQFEFQRTLSRLNEMQTKDYLSESASFDKSSVHAIKASS